MEKPNESFGVFYDFISGTVCRKLNKKASSFLIPYICWYKHYEYKDLETHNQINPF
jgi:tryptophan-rich sensory protein